MAAEAKLFIWAFEFHLSYSAQGWTALCLTHTKYEFDPARPSPNKQNSKKKNFYREFEILLFRAECRSAIQFEKDEPKLKSHRAVCRARGKCDSP